MVTDPRQVDTIDPPSVSTEWEPAVAGTEESDTPLAWEGRVLAVALFWSIPGTFLGTMIAVVLSASFQDATPIIVLSGLVGSIAGGLLEAEHW